MVKAITFDCWDTLLADDPSRTNKKKEYFRQIFNENDFPITESEIDDLFLKEGKLFENHIIEHRKTQNSRMRVKNIVQLAQIGMPAPDIDRIADYCDRIALDYPPPVVTGVEDVLKVLSKTYGLAVICNTGWHSGETVRHLLEEYGLTQYFSHLTFSDEAGIAKPHKQIFEYTLGKLHCSPEEAVHIGDSEYSDIVGAKEAKMGAILFAGINDRYKDSNSADITISTYDNLLDTLQQIF